MEEKKEKQIEELISIAFKEGVEKALKIVKEIQDPYLLDEFHDRLIEEIKKRNNF
jgi:hypothetical protein